MVSDNTSVVCDGTSIVNDDTHVVSDAEVITGNQVGLGQREFFRITLFSKHPPIRPRPLTTPQDQYSPQRPLLHATPRDLHISQQLPLFSPGFSDIHT